MCWNQTISLNTFIFSFFAINFAYLNNIADIYYYLFFLSFSSIQLVEYFAWGNLNNKKTIRLLSQIGLFLVSMQPILLILSIKNVEYNIKASVIALYCAFCAIGCFIVDSILLWFITICKRIYKFCARVNTIFLYLLYLL